MRVAIIGAGLAGLSCALELEKHGIWPTVFEREDYIGEQLIDAAAMLTVFNRCKGSPVEYLKQMYGISITPAASLKKITMLSPNREMTAEGNLGDVFLRGREESSLEKQLFSGLKSSVLMNTDVTLDEVKGCYDFVIAATGEKGIAEQLGVWNQTFRSFVRVAKILGEFTPGDVMMWLNTKYCKNGYAYLIPINEKRADLVQIVNDVSQDEFEFYWREFLTDEKISYAITETRDFYYFCGTVRPVRAGNILLAGNSGGFVDSLLGFGMLNAMESGCMAARALVYGHDYDGMTRPIYRQIRKLHEFRKAVNKLEQDGLDRLVSAMDHEGINRFIYNNEHFKTTQGTFAVRLFNAIKNLNYK